MKSKVVIVILLLVCAGLGVALVTRENKSKKEKEDLAQKLTYQSEEVKQTKAKLDEQRQVNMSLEGDLKTRAGELASLSNNLNKVIVDLEKSDAAAKATADQLRNAQAELAKKDSQIGALEAERTALGKHMDTLTNSIGNLEQQIASTQTKLTRAEGDKDLLWKELKRLQAEKAELERQFNDFAVMRAQVSKLKEELAISRRLEFIRLSLFGSTAKGGAEKLMPHADKNPANRGSATNYNLDVEIRQSAASSVAPTVTNNTPAPILAPAATNAAAKPPAPAPAEAK
jgi:septal ring factor EnvC (AmiA/AmiB activator)